jgi:hypothetical protein
VGVKKDLPGGMSDKTRKEPGWYWYCPVDGGSEAKRERKHGKKVDTKDLT